MGLRIPVWDAPVRLFHWALAVLVVFSYTTGKIGGSWLEWHMRSGYTILALLAFRLAWGVVGSETARFALLPARAPRPRSPTRARLVSRKHRDGRRAQAHGRLDDRRDARDPRRAGGQRPLRG